jgi:four helix bundle protein
MKYETKLRNKNRGFMKLIVWQKAIQLFELAWKIAYRDAKVDFKLRSQFVDAVQSVSANISEGYARRSINEYIQFLYIALGSMGEALTRYIGLNLTEQVAADRLGGFDTLHYEVENRLLRLVEKLEEKRDSGDWTTRIAEEVDDPDFALMIEHSTTPPLHYSITPSPRCDA